ncbi:MAG: phage tail assembly chaperone family protein, TAC [Psychrobacter sp.]
MAKLSLSDIKSGSLVSQVRDEVVEFFHNGEEMSVDIRIKQLPFVETESLFKRLYDGENVSSEWISKALVDDKGKVMFTKQQVENTFVQPLAVAVFDKVYGADNLKKSMDKAKKKAS